MTEPVLKPSDGFEYYQNTIYFNNFEESLRRMCHLISGEPNTWWDAYVKRKYGVKPRGLFANCGNGWVERACFGAGLVQEVVGFDITDKLLSEATREAAAVGMPASYVKADGNRLHLDQPKFDVIINHAAIHHIAYLDRLLRQFHSLLADDGLYVIFDYTGAHRNQYSWQAWSETVQLNARLPKEYRAELNYAHIATMLHADPTEAIHSELEMDVTRRYFDVVEEAQLVSPIAYSLLYNNQALYRDRQTDAGSRMVDHILSVDAEFLAKDPASNLITFAICKPKATLPEPSILDLWTAEEEKREADAAANNGRYYPPTTLELIYNDLADMKDENRMLKSRSTVA